MKDQAAAQGSWIASSTRSSVCRTSAGRFIALLVGLATIVDSDDNEAAADERLRAIRSPVSDKGERPSPDPARCLRGQPTTSGGDDAKAQVPLA
jgi:hypothetical protein